MFLFASVIFLFIYFWWGSLGHTQDIEGTFLVLYSEISPGELRVLGIEFRLLQSKQPYSHYDNFGPEVIF